MFLQGPNQNQNADQCWKNLPYGFKALLIFSIFNWLFSNFLTFYNYLYNLSIAVIQNFQIWRLFTSFIVEMPGLQGIISLLFNFYILFSCLPAYQTKYSTVFTLFNIISTTFIINLGILILFIIGHYVIGLSAWNFISFGLLPYIFTMLWQQASQNPQTPTRFCFLPCLIPRKMMPWCFLALLTLFGNPLLPNLIACLVGFYQYMILKNDLIKLPLSLYVNLQSCIPRSTLQDPSFIKISNVEQNIKQKSSEGICKMFSHLRSNNNRNPFDDQIASPPQIILPQGKGVVLNQNKSQNTDYRQYWNKQEKYQQQTNGQLRIKQDIV